MKGASHHCSAAWACYLTASSRQSLFSTSHDFPLPPPQPNGKPAQSEFEALKWNYKLPKGFIPDDVYITLQGAQQQGLAPADLFGVWPSHLSCTTFGAKLSCPIWSMTDTGNPSQPLTQTCWVTVQFATIASVPRAACNPYRKHCHGSHNAWT